MVKVPVYGYTTGVFSARKIARKLNEDVAFRRSGRGHRARRQAASGNRRGVSAAHRSDGGEDEDARGTRRLPPSQVTGRTTQRLDQEHVLGFRQFSIRQGLNRAQAEWTRMAGGLRALPRNNACLEGPHMEPSARRLRVQIGEDYVALMRNDIRDGMNSITAVRKGH